VIKNLERKNGISLCATREPILIKSFSRFFGSFEPLFDLFLEVNIDNSILTSKNKSKIGQNNPENRRKILLG